MTLKRLLSIGLITLSTLSLSSCLMPGNDPNNEGGGGIDVNNGSLVLLDLNGTAKKLKSVGEYMVKVESKEENGQTVMSGYIVVHFSPGMDASAYAAFNPICPNHTDSKQVAVEMSEADQKAGKGVLPFKCPSCNTIYELGNGLGVAIDPTGKQPLNTYSVSIIENRYLRIHPSF